ncbi:MAG: hypothetical protein JRI53_12730 [Deltaproteobacteria bacterium]|nr:hypothetical protein [Deltaproteobacteria bacterium]MBW1985575.1 hypothetical protein [Deltaproteobacteria bacterium]
MFIEIVKGIKSDKSGAYDNLLTEEDKNLLSKTILLGSWYPYDVYKRCFNALAQVIAKGDMEICKQWGHAQGEGMIKSVYKSVLKEKNYKTAMEKFISLFKLMYDFGELSVSFISDNEMEVAYKDFDPDFQVSYIVAQGWVEKILEICGCKDVKSKFLVKSWEGAGATALHFSWTS